MDRSLSHLLFCRFFGFQIRADSRALIFRYQVRQLARRYGLDLQIYRFLQASRSSLDHGIPPETLVDWQPEGRPFLVSRIILLKVLA